MDNGIDKKAMFKMKTEPYLKPISDLGVGFYNLDENTAIIQFQLTNNSGPLMISDNNVKSYAYFESKNGSASDVIDLEIIDNYNGIVQITLPKDFLQASTDTKVTGQVYIGVNNVSGKPEYNEVAVFREFNFEVKDALINKISSFTKIEYIRMFDQLKTRIEQQVKDIEKAIANGADYVAEMKTVREQGVKEINKTVTDGKAYIDSVIAQAQTNINDTSTSAIGDVNTAKNNAISTMNDKVEESVSNVENVSNDAVIHVDDKLNEFNQAILDNDFVQPETLQQTLDNLQWQKHKTTTDSGHNFDIDLNGSMENLRSLAPGVYYSIRTPILPNISGSGYLIVLMREEDHINTPVKKIFFMPYNSNRIFHMRGYRDNWYEGWSEVTNNQTDTGWISFSLINGAESNTAYKNEGDGGFDCAYRIITNGSVTEKRVRINASNLTHLQQIATLPTNFAKNVQFHYVRVPINCGYGLVGIYPNGNMYVYIESDKRADWDSTSNVFYFYGEFGWKE